MSKVFPDTIYLYIQGNECTDITGGWNFISASGKEPMSFQKVNNYLRLYASYGGKYGYCAPFKSIDLTDVENIKITYSVTSSVNTATGLFVSIDNTENNTYQLPNQTSAVEQTINVSSYSGLHYIYVGGFTGGGSSVSLTTDIKIYSVALSS